LAELCADETLASEVWRETMGIWVVGRVHAAERVREVHVDFDEEVGEEHEGVVGDVGCGADGESTLVGGGEVNEEPESL
jgi:hypothetical protein